MYIYYKIINSILVSFSCLLFAFKRDYATIKTSTHVLVQQLHSPTNLNNKLLKNKNSVKVSTVNDKQRQNKLANICNWSD